MKKFICILLSAIMLTTVTAGIDFSAYAGSYDTVGTARQYDIGSSMSGCFSDPVDIDYIVFTLTSSGRIDFTFTGSDRYSVYILDNSATTIRENLFIEYNNDLGMAYNDKLSVHLTAGTYYLKLMYGSYKTNVNYQINSRFVNSNESFQENQTINNNIIGNANPINLDTSYLGQIGDNDLVDFYSFTVLDGVYNINIKADENICYYIYTMNGNEIQSYSASLNTSIGYAEKTDSVSLSTGTYCLKISRYALRGAAYTFSITSPHQHAYNYAYTVAPTYAEQGYDLYGCSCGDSYCTNYTPVKKLSKVTLSSVKATGKKKIKVIWKKKSGASGYQIYWATDKNFKKVVSKTIVKYGKTTSYTGKNFTKGKKYYVKVRAYKTINGKKVYGSWSTVKSVKCK